MALLSVEGVVPTRLGVREVVVGIALSARLPGRTLVPGAVALPAVVLVLVARSLVEGAVVTVPRPVVVRATVLVLGRPVVVRETVPAPARPVVAEVVVLTGGRSNWDGPLVAGRLEPRVVKEDPGL